jgi:uncharacterized protein YabE (DUF348 family)
MPGTTEVWSKVRRSAKSLAVHAFVIVALVGGTTAFVSFNKKVTLTVDGRERTIHTFAGTVGELLDRQDITLSEHDRVAPAASAELADGTHVAVRYGRLLRLTVDGQPRESWTTATSVEEALQQLNVRAEGAYLSASRSERIGRQGLQLDVRTARRINLVIDGQRNEVVTTEPTVNAMLDREGIRLGRYDLVSVPLESFPRADSTIEITRLNGVLVRKKVFTPYETRKISEPSQLEGWKDVVTEGVRGITMVTYEQQVVDGKKKFTRVIKREVLRKPVTEVVKVGSKAVPTSVAGADDLNWAALAQCESGGRPKAINPAGPYYGLYQFSASTWRSVGGTGLPSDATPAEQTFRAKKLYARSGAGQWPVCGKKLFT